MARGKVIRQKFITRADLRANPKTFYLFGDNMKRAGFGGQAKHMRGEPNAIGIPTKWSPDMRFESFFRDDDSRISYVRCVIKLDFRSVREVLESGYDVVIPEDGLGTGLADLKKTAPMILDLIERCIKNLERRMNDLNDD